MIVSFAQGQYASTDLSYVHFFFMVYGMNLEPGASLSSTISDTFKILSSLFSKFLKALDAIFFF